MRKSTSEEATGAAGRRHRKIIMFCTKGPLSLSPQDDEQTEQANGGSHMRCVASGHVLRGCLAPPSHEMARTQLDFLSFSLDLVACLLAWLLVRACVRYSVRPSVRPLSAYPQYCAYFVRR